MIFGLQQCEGEGYAFIQIKKGLASGSRLHLLKVECTICLNHDQPDPYPFTWPSFDVGNKLAHVATFNSPGFRGLRHISATLAYSLSPNIAVIAILPPLPSSGVWGPPNEKSVYAAECEERSEFLETKVVEVKIDQKADFSNSKIGE